MTIELITTKELLDELHKRFDAYVFHGARVTDQESVSRLYVWRYGGDEVLVAGLATNAAHRANVHLTAVGEDVGLDEHL